MPIAAMERFRKVNENGNLCHEIFARSKILQSPEQLDSDSEQSLTNDLVIERPIRKTRPHDRGAVADSCGLAAFLRTAASLQKLPSFLCLVGFGMQFQQLLEPPLCDLRLAACQEQANDIQPALCQPFSVLNGFVNQLARLHFGGSWLL